MPTCREWFGCREVPECREDAEPDEERRGGGERGLPSCARVAMIASYSDCKVATVCSDRFLKTASSSIFSAIVTVHQHSEAGVCFPSDIFMSVSDTKVFVLELYLHYFNKGEDRSLIY